MEDWKPENPAILEFDLNECTPREFCEVFGMDLSLANYLQEYRSEVLHIFRLEQLLKLKGISEERLQDWCDPKPNAAFDAELQRALSLQTESPEPLPQLLQGIGKQTGTSVCLMARYGTMLIEPAADASSPDSPIKDLPDFVRSVQEDMFQLHLGTASLQLIGFENGDLLFLPASAFYIAAKHPKGSLDPALISTWRSLAAEVQRRHPPKIVINNNAPVTENDVVFNCPKCNLKIVVDRAGIGYTFPCPRCKNSVTIPGVPDST